MSFNLFYCNQMNVHFQQDERALKYITRYYTSPVNSEKRIKLIICDKIRKSPINKNPKKYSNND